MLNVDIHIFVNHHLVHPTHGTNHEYALLGGIDHLCTRLVFQNAIAVLHGHDELALLVGKTLLDMLEKKDVPDMEHIVDTESKDFEHRKY